MRAVRLAIHCALVGASSAAPLAAQAISRVSVSAAGVEGNLSSGPPVLSADGRYAVFASSATNLVAGDTNGAQDVFLVDRWTGAVERVNVSAGGVQANAASDDFHLSPDARYVVFTSTATNLVVGDTNAKKDVFLRDRTLGTTEIVSLTDWDTLPTEDSSGPDVSADGRTVVFSCSAWLDLGDVASYEDVFVRDRALGTTTRITVGLGGALPNGHSAAPRITPDGRFVVYRSSADNLVPGDSNLSTDVFLFDRALGTTERVSVSSAGVEGDSGSAFPSITPDGRYVLFESGATNLVPGDTNAWTDVFVRDRVAGTTERVSVSSAGAQGNRYSLHPFALSDDGRFVTFWSTATTLVAGDTNAASDVFLRDRALGLTTRASVDGQGGQLVGGSLWPSLTGDGRWLGYSSLASTLVPNDTNGTWDAFVVDRVPTGFALRCQPGSGGTAACPCGNPPAGPERGCDNSSGTGGATIAAAGLGYLGQDSLVFTTSGEKPSAATIVVQGDVLNAAGVVFGQGVRCVGGAQKRMYTKTAVAGAITAPDLGAGDPTVSARAAALGDVLSPGKTRYYFAYYRDPIVLGGCSPASTFNVTPVGSVTWWP